MNVSNKRKTKLIFVPPTQQKQKANKRLANVLLIPMPVLAPASPFQVPWAWTLFPAPEGARHILDSPWLGVSPWLKPVSWCHTKPTETYQPDQHNVFPLSSESNEGASKNRTRIAVNQLLLHTRSSETGSDSWYLLIRIQMEIHTRQKTFWLRHLRFCLTDQLRDLRILLQFWRQSSLSSCKESHGSDKSFLSNREHASASCSRKAFNLTILKHHTFKAIFLSIGEGHLIPIWNVIFECQFSWSEMAASSQRKWMDEWT